MTKDDFYLSNLVIGDEVEITHSVGRSPITETYTLVDAIVYAEIYKKHYPSGERELVPEE